MQVKNLSAGVEKTVGVNSKIILKNVSFKIERGELVALCGKNGAGKSTLLSVMAGVYGAEMKIDGEVLLDGKKIADYKRKDLAKKLAYMEQTEYSTWDFLVKDFVLQGRFAYSKNGYYSDSDYEIVRKVIEEVGISDLAERTVHTLSGGEFQKVRIARSLAQEPEFMLLDEPAANLDFVYEPKLMRMLKDFCVSKNIGIVLSMHDVNLAGRYADKMILMPPAAPVIFGKSSDVLNEENLKNTFGVEFIKGSAEEAFVPKL